MKKITLMATFAASLLAASALHAQTATTSARASITARNNSRLTRQLRQIERQSTEIRTTVAPRTDGVVPRTVRSGNPLQMVNPLAPAEYGDGHDVTRRESDDPYQRAQGLKLFAVEF